MLPKLLLYIFFLFTFNNLKAEEVEKFLNNKYAPMGDFAFFTLGKFTKGDDGYDYYNGMVNAVFYADDSSHSLHKSTVKCPSVYKINIEKGIGEFSGTCIFTDSSGEYLKAVYSGKGGSTNATGEFKWVDGNGKYKPYIGKSGGYWKGFIVVNPENWEIGGVQGWTYLNK
jgi:hypothetical protein